MNQISHDTLRSFSKIGIKSISPGTSFVYNLYHITGAVDMIRVPLVIPHFNEGKWSILLS